MSYHSIPMRPNTEITYYQYNMYSVCNYNIIICSFVIMYAFCMKIIIHLLHCQYYVESNCHFIYNMDDMHIMYGCVIVLMCLYACT